MKVVLCNLVCRFDIQNPMPIPIREIMYTIVAQSVHLYFKQFHRFKYYILNNISIRVSSFTSCEQLLGSIVGVPLASLATNIP